MAGAMAHNANVTDYRLTGPTMSVCRLTLTPYLYAQANACVNVCADPDHADIDREGDLSRYSDAGGNMLLYQ